MIASRCLISFWSCSTVGLGVDLALRARAVAEPSSVTPSNASNVIAVMLVDTRRTRLALNPSSPNLPSVFPPTANVDRALLEHYKITRVRLQPVRYFAAVSTHD